MPNRPQNLKAALDALQDHRAQCPECQTRFDFGKDALSAFASEIPLSHGTPEATLQQIWRDQALKSLQLLYPAGIPMKPDGSLRVEVMLGTENDVFTYAGPFRHPHSESGFLFKADLETYFPRGMTATSFDSGGLACHLRPKRPMGTARDFLEANELSVPEYRNLLREFVATLFRPPSDYYTSNKFPKCDIPLMVEGETADARRHTFEIRFEGSVPLVPNLLAVFLPSNVATEEYGKDIISICREHGIEIVILNAENIDQNYDQLLVASQVFLSDFLNGEQQ